MSINASDNIKDNKYIYGLLKNVIKELEKQMLCKLLQTMDQHL